MFSGPCVISQDVARNVFDAGLVVTLFVDITHNNHTIYYDGGRRGAEIP